MTLSNPTRILITLGGARPGLGYYDAITGHFKEWTVLPKGQSVYSIDCDDKGKALWIGTRAGQLYRIDVRPDSDSNAELVYDFGTHDSILDIALISTTCVATAHESGRCSLYGIADNEELKPLDTRARAPYALFCPDRKHVAGLTTDELLVWDIDGHIVFASEIPEPANWLSLIKPVFFSQAGLWLWPDNYGRLVTYCHVSRHLAVHPGHNGPFYGIAESPAGLISAGFNDRTLKIWNDQLELANEISVSALPIISVFSWEDAGTNLLFTQATGECGVYKLQGDRVDLIANSDLKDCRLLFSPDRQALATAIADHKKHTAAEIARQITNSHSNPAVVESLHKELLELGFENVSLLLRAEHARANEDLVQELGFYHRLFELAGFNEPNMAESLLRFGNLLDMLWQIRSAHRMFSALGQLTLDDAIGQRQSRLAQTLQVLDNSAVIINPGDVSLEQILRTSQISGEAVNGRFIINTLKSHSQSLPHISPHDYVKSFDHNSSDIPEPKVLTATILNGHTPTSREVVIFSAGQPEIKGLELAFTFTHIAGETRIVPMTVFNTHSIPAEAPKRVESLLRQYRMCKDGSISHPWLARVHAASDHVLRQFITLRKSLSNSLPQEI